MAWVWWDLNPTQLKLALFTLTQRCSHCGKTLRVLSEIWDQRGSYSLHILHQGTTPKPSFRSGEPGTAEGTPLVFLWGDKVGPCAVCHSLLWMLSSVVAAWSRPLLCSAVLPGPPQAPHPSSSTRSGTQNNNSQVLRCPSLTLAFCK